VAKVYVVADWGSFRLQGFPFEDRVAMAEEIESCNPAMASVSPAGGSVAVSDWRKSSRFMARPHPDSFFTATAGIRIRGPEPLCLFRVSAFA
jgi:hypothetical protein